jgi:hypothetical protein
MFLPKKYLRIIVKINQNELKETLAQHGVWLNSDGKNGKRADWCGADLSTLDLSKQILRRVNFQRANLSKTNLRSADLRSANLEGAILKGALLEEADLRDANLFEANLQQANLKLTRFKGADLLLTNIQKADFEEADFEGAKNLEHAILDKSQKYILEQISTNIDEVERLEEALNSAKQTTEENESLAQQIKQLQSDKNKTEEEKNQAIETLRSENDSNNAKVLALSQELEEAKKARDESQDTELSTAIEKISSAGDNSSNTLKTYQFQSKLLMFSAMFAFLVGVIVAAWVYYTKIYTSIDISLTTHISLFSPSFLLSILGAALLRHDWKIRQLAQQLITQKNRIDIATGILESSLNLTRIDNIEKEELKILKDSFNDMRHALLFGTYDNLSTNSNAQETDAKGILQLLKILSKGK